MDPSMLYKIVWEQIIQENREIDFLYEYDDVKRQIYPPKWPIF